MAWLLDELESSLRWAFFMPMDGRYDAVPLITWM